MTTRVVAFLRLSIVRALSAAVIGALVGLGVFELTIAGGRWLFIVTGLLAGIAVVALGRIYNKAARLTEVKLMLPQVSELTFVVDNASRRMAWRLFVETVTRVSTQPLGNEDGVLREAMTSLYTLFATTRDVLKEGFPSAPIAEHQTVEHFAIAMLNSELRPFLSKWHSQLLEWERTNPNLPEARWEAGAECRIDLRRVQGAIKEYAVGYAQLAGVSDPHRMIGPVSE